MALSSCMLGLSTIFIALRFFTRNAQKAPLKADDWLMVPCLVRVHKPILSSWMKPSYPQS